MLGGAGLSAADALVRLERLVVAGVESADRGFSGLEEAMILSERHRLTVYDALYLQLALDVEGELATLDAKLRKAAIAEDLPIIERGG
jgi:predicted nucleic acid-binding protein